MRCLVVEDNPRLASSLARGMREEAIETELITTGQGAMAVMTTRGFDVVILDLGLPDIDGLEVIRWARTRLDHCPILVLTARDAVPSRVEALELGADDYLVKPFAFEELLARIHALARRATGPRWMPAHVGSLVLADDLSITSGDHRAVLSPTEHALLARLLKQPGELVRRVEILLDVFGYAFDPGTNVVDVHLSHLRRKLASFPLRIETVRGVGFRLELG
jgi:DNA-binding response OmpR family regulator